MVLFVIDFLLAGACVLLQITQETVGVASTRRRNPALQKALNYPVVLIAIKLSAFINNNIGTLNADTYFVGKKIIFFWEFLKMKKTDAHLSPLRT